MSDNSTCAQCGRFRGDHAGWCPSLRCTCGAEPSLYCPKTAHRLLARRSSPASSVTADEGTPQ